MTAPEHPAESTDCERNAVLAQYASDVVLIVDADLKVQYLSPSAERQMGYREEEWLGHSALDAVHPDDVERAAEAFGRALGTPGVNEPLEIRAKQIGAGWRWFEVVASNLIEHPAIRGVVLCARDINDLRDTQSQQIADLRRFDALLANLSDMVTVIDAHGNMSYVSPAAQQLVGRQAEDRLGASIFDYVHPDDAPRAADVLAQALATPGHTTEFDARVLHEDGTYRTWEVRAKNLLDDPLVQGIIVNSRDVTDRVKVEAALHESERLYRTIVENANEGIWIIDTDAVTTFANTRLAAMFGLPAAAIVGRHVFEFLDNAGRDAATLRLERRRAGIGEQHDIQLYRQDGSAFWALISAAPLMDDDGTYHGSIALVTDITDRRNNEADLRAALFAQQRQKAELDRHRLEAELNRSRRLESIGRLAAGVAHDFNNLVGVILNFAAAAAKQLEPASSAAGDIAQIQYAAEQAAEVTRKLLTFGRADPLRLEVFDLNEIIVDVIQLVDRSFGQEIALAKQLTPHPCLIEADLSQTEQLLMNLLINARDALPNGGTIRVSTESGDTTSSTEDGTPPSVVLTVADNGIGMSPDVLARAFEPFFTTKNPDRGTGLGLATVHSIVTRANGHVRIESTPQRGTTVKVSLPSR